jgi:hypothetical protein
VTYYTGALTAGPDALRGGFAAYRALDATIAQNQQRTTRPLTLPVLAIGGAEGIGEGPRPPCGSPPTTCIAWSSPAAATTAPRRPQDMLATLAAFPALPGEQLNERRRRHGRSRPRAPRRGDRGLRGGDRPGPRRTGVELYALHEGPGRLVMIEKYESEQARAEHAKGAALAGLRSALEGKLSSPPGAQVLAPHPAGNPHKGAL